MSKQGTIGPDLDRLRMDENGWKWLKAKYKIAKAKYKLL